MNLPAADLPGLHDADALLCRSFEQAFATAVQRTRPEAQTIALGGLAVHLEIAGPALAARLLRPFHHLIVASRETPAFHVQAWSEEETGVAIPEFPFAPRPYSPDGTIGYRNQLNGRALADRRGKRILAGFDSPAALTYSDLAKPFRSLLIAMLHDSGRQMIHGGVVAAAPTAPGLLLAGRSGSGKSTVALAALAGGLAFLGDDHVAVDAMGGRFTAHSLYATCGLASDHVAAFAHLPGEVASAPDRDKRVVLLAPAAMDRLVRSLQLGAIVIPAIMPGAATRAIPATRGEALRALIPGSVSPRLPAHKPDRGWQFDGVGELAMHLPAFRLEMGHDLAAIPEALRDLSARLVRQ